MGTTTEELKKLYAKLGGTDPNIPKASTPGEVLNGINELELGGDKLPEVTEADNGKALGVKQGQWDKMDVDIELPDVTTDDNGKVLMVSEGNWKKANLPTELPAVTASDNGSILSVVDGAWAKSVAGGDIVVYTATQRNNSNICDLNNGKTTLDIYNDISAGKIVAIYVNNGVPKLFFHTEEHYANGNFYVFSSAYTHDGNPYIASMSFTRQAMPLSIMMITEYRLALYSDIPTT